MCRSVKDRVPRVQRFGTKIKQITNSNFQRETYLIVFGIWYSRFICVLEFGICYFYQNLFYNIHYRIILNGFCR